MKRQRIWTVLLLCLLAVSCAALAACSDGNAVRQLRVEGGNVTVQYNMGFHWEDEITIFAVHADGTEEQLISAEVDVDDGGFNPSVPDTYTFTVTYSADPTISATFTVTVAQPQVVSVEPMTDDRNTILEWGEEFDPSELLLYVTYADGSSQVVSEGFNVNLEDFDPFKSGDCQVLVEYQGWSGCITLHVNPPTYDGINSLVRFEQALVSVGDAVLVIPFEEGCYNYYVPYVGTQPISVSMVVTNEKTVRVKSRNVRDSSRGDVEVVMDVAEGVTASIDTERRYCFYTRDISSIGNLYLFREGQEGNAIKSLSFGEMYQNQSLTIDCLALTARAEVSSSYDFVDYVIVKVDGKELTDETKLAVKNVYTISVVYKNDLCEEQLLSFKLTLEEFQLVTGLSLTSRDYFTGGTLEATKTDDAFNFEITLDGTKLKLNSYKGSLLDLLKTAKATLAEGYDNPTVEVTQFRSVAEIKDNKDVKYAYASEEEMRARSLDVIGDNEFVVKVSSGDTVQNCKVVITAKAGSTELFNKWNSIKQGFDLEKQEFVLTERATKFATQLYSGGLRLRENLAAVTELVGGSTGEYYYFFHERMNGASAIIYNEWLVPMTLTVQEEAVDSVFVNGVETPLAVADNNFFVAAFSGDLSQSYDVKFVYDQSKYSLFDETGAAVSSGSLYNLDISKDVYAFKFAFFLKGEEFNSNLDLAYQKVTVQIVISTHVVKISMMDNGEEVEAEDWTLDGTLSIESSDMNHFSDITVVAEEGYSYKLFDAVTGEYLANGFTDHVFTPEYNVFYVVTYKDGKIAGYVEFTLYLMQDDDISDARVLQTWVENELYVVGQNQVVKFNEKVSKVYAEDGSEIADKTIKFADDAKEYHYLHVNVDFANPNYTVKASCWVMKEQYYYNEPSSMTLYKIIHSIYINDIRVNIGCIFFNNAYLDADPATFDFDNLETEASFWGDNMGGSWSTIYEITFTADKAHSRINFVVTNKNTSEEFFAGTIYVQKSTSTTMSLSQVLAANS